MADQRDQQKQPQPDPLRERQGMENPLAGEAAGGTPAKESGGSPNAGGDRAGHGDSTGVDTARDTAGRGSGRL
jgi:hypothetical protein